MSESTRDDAIGDAKPSGSRGRRRAFAICVGVLVALVLLEVGLRIHNAVVGIPALDPVARQARENSAWQASNDPELVYVHRPDSTHRGKPLTNAQGIIRRGSVSRSKPADTYRVVVLGDSIGAGLSLDEVDRFPAVLERLLLARKPSGAARAQVLNFCVDGYDTAQEARLLETTAGAFEPDAIVLQYCMNDPGESTTPMAWFRDPDPPLSEAAALLLRAVRMAAGRPAGTEIVPLGGPNGEADALWERLYDPVGAGWTKVLSGFDRIAAWAGERDVPVFVAVVPLLQSSDPAGESTKGYRTQVVAAAETRGFRVVSLRDAFHAAGVSALVIDPRDIYHPNAKGHRIVARAVHERILEERQR